MTPSRRPRHHRPRTDAELAADALHRLRELATATSLADGAPTIDPDPTYAGLQDDAVQDAVNTARNAGVSWQDIGEALGIRRGNAYQRYRDRRPP